MIAKTQEGLIGANNAMNVIRTPMKVFKEARARGDKETMDRAMGYVEKAHDEAWEKKYSADEGLKQEAEENKAKAEQAREELAQRIKENKEKLTERTEESKGEELQADVAVKETDNNSENALEENIKLVENAVLNEAAPKPITYDSNGTVKIAEANTKLNIIV